MKKVKKKIIRKKKQASSKKNLVSTTQYAELVGVSRQIVARHIKKGHLSKSISKQGRKYLIDVELAKDEWDLIKSQHAPKDSGPDIDVEADLQLVDCGEFGKLPTIKSSRTADEYYRAQLKKLEYEEKDGSLLDADLVMSEWLDYINNSKSRLLAIPQKAAQQILGLEDVVEIEEILKAFINESLEELSRGES